MKPSYPYNGYSHAAGKTASLLWNTSSRALPFGTEAPERGCNFTCVLSKVISWELCRPSNTGWSNGLVLLGNYPTLAREFQGFKVWGKFVFRTLELTDTPTNVANQVKVGHVLDHWSNRADLRECTKTMRHHWDRRGQIIDFQDSFERIKCLFKICFLNVG